MRSGRPTTRSWSARAAAGTALKDRTPPAAPQIYDLRIDHAALSDHPSPQHHNAYSADRLIAQPTTLRLTEEAVS